MLHQRVFVDLLFALEIWTRAAPGRGLAMAPLDVRLNERNVYNPDILWHAEDRAPRRWDNPPYPMPSLAIEVRSESTWRYDIGVKKPIYEQQGLRALWLVELFRTEPVRLGVAAPAAGRRRASASRAEPPIVVCWGRDNSRAESNGQYLSPLRATLGAAPAGAITGRGGHARARARRLLWIAR